MAGGVGTPDHLKSVSNKQICQSECSGAEKMLDDLSFGHILVIVLVLVLLFGPKKIPDLAQSLGKGIREFKKAMRDVTDEVQTAVKEEPRPQTVPPRAIESANVQSLKTESKSETEIKS